MVKARLPGMLFASLFWAGVILLWSDLAMPETGGVTVSASVSPSQPYVQQQVTYTLTAHRHSHLQRGYFMTPEVPGAILRLIDKGAPQAVQVDGQTMERIEQRYLLFPQRSGVLELPGPVFSSRDLFVRGEAIRLPVSPAPEASDLNSWTIVKELGFEQQWVIPDQALVGDPIERIVTITGRGALGAQLPQLSHPVMSDVEVHRLPAQLSEQVVEGDMVGTRVERILYIPLLEGPLILPDLKLSWWESAADLAQVSTLDRMRVSIAAAPSLGGTIVLPKSEAVGSPENWLMYWLERSTPFLQFLGGLLAIVILAYLLPWQTISRRVRAYWWISLFYREWKRGDPAETRNALLNWAAVYGIDSYYQLSLHVGRQSHLVIGLAMNAVDQGLYAADRDGWNHPDLGIEVAKSLLRISTFGERVEDRSLLTLWPE